MIKRYTPMSYMFLYVLVYMYLCVFWGEKPFLFKGFLWKNCFLELGFSMEKWFWNRKNLIKK